MFSTLFFTPHVTITEGLINVLGGGVTRAFRPVFPSHLGLYLVAILDVSSAESDIPLVFRIVDIDSDDVVLTEIAADATQIFGPEEDVDPRVMSNPFVVDLTSLVIPKPGTYRVETTVNGKESIAINLQVLAQ
ncbi:hypothetical protein CH296_19745 [Rhodococcus sp. 14-2496-1d]|uniref:DUF6941 family protein n=1 Tax=Rhodococcus sp. 14-2496-1d TaxID=2023146 RepID=UPI000B9A53BD|nr:hypothetical protein [Rhodococcus sp. 14-2496-1d]OZF28356.1 hypothetical protein CH296_19745 [Rhodococcus sp. 14-2496-1d]